MTNYEKHRTEIVPIERMGRKVIESGYDMNVINEYEESREW